MCTSEIVQRKHTCSFSGFGSLCGLCDNSMLYVCSHCCDTSMFLFGLAVICTSLKFQFPGP